MSIVLIEILIEDDSALNPMDTILPRQTLFISSVKSTLEINRVGLGMRTYYLFSIGTGRDK